MSRAGDRAPDTRYGLTDESRALRATRIGTSELGAIAGIHPFVSPWQVWDRIVLGAERPQLERMRLGAQLEGAVARIWSERSGRPIRRNRRTLVRGNLASTADAYIVGERALLEVKVSGNAGLWGSGLPEWIRYQAIGQAIVYRVRTVVVVALISGTTLREYVVEPTRADRRGIRELVQAFWTAHIDTGEIPLPMFPQDLAPYLRVLQGRAPELRRAATPAEQDLAEHYLGTRRAVNELKAQADGQREWLLNAIRFDPRETIVGDGWTYQQDPESGRITIHDQRKDGTE